MNNVEVIFIDTLKGWFDWTSEKSRNGILSIKQSDALVDTPWWSTIIGITVGLRIAVFPLKFRAWRNGRLMKLAVEHCNKELAPKLRTFHQQMTVVDKRGELYKADMLKVHRETIKSVGGSPWKSLTPLPVSIPLFLSVAAGLRGIDFNGEGLGWIWRNFGESDPISAVPVTISNLILLEQSRRSISTSSGTGSIKLSKKLPLILGHALNICSFIVLSHVPSSVNLFLFISSIFSFFESKFLLNDRNALFDKLIQKQFYNKIR